MKEQKYGFLKRLLALALSLVMVLHLMPALGLEAKAAAQIPSKTADASTQDIWGDLVTANQSTQYLGRVWTDKTVAATRVDGGKTYGVSLEYKLNGSGDTTTTQHTILEANANADFQIVLSAVSSTASYVKTEYSLLPLDIVLVLDVSGSMVQQQNYIYTYTAASAPYNYYTDYYVEVNGEYRQVQYNGSGTDRVSYNFVYRTGGPNSSTTIYNSKDYTIYTRTGVSRLTALKNAVTAFLTEVQKLNANIPNENSKHRVSIVTFAAEGSDTYTKTRLALSSNISEAIRITNNLSASGGTYPDEGMNLAINQLKNARTSASKYVLFFTDGHPCGAHSNGNANEFGEDTAADTVNLANTIKNTYDATIYSVAVIDDATAADLKKPSISTKGNATTVDNESVIDYMMHAISSNYPNATATGSSGNQQASWTLTMGTRAADSNYYFATTDADELKKIFTEIAESVTNSGTGSATHITAGNESSADGYVTMVDVLGDYMEIKSLDAITIEGVVYYYTDSGVGASSSTTGSGYTDTTYVFTKAISLNTTLNARTTGTASTENLNHIIITERDYDDPATRDTLTVQIPASMLPLRYYSVDENGDLTIKETLPVRVVYSVGLLDDVRDAVNTGNYSAVNGLSTYVAGHTADGQVAFYSNYYDGKDSNGDGYIDGNTYSTFAPAVNNSFYYYTEDTPFLDANGDPIKSTGSYENDLKSITVYYAHEYYQLNADGTTTQKSELIGLSIDAAINGIGITWAQNDISKYIGVDADGNYYMKKGFAKLSLANDTDFIEDKGTGNATNTATTVLNPSWSYNISPNQTIGTDYANYKTMNYLGNNGRITYAGLGSLTISKTVSADPMLTPGANEFEFTITMGSAVAGTYTAARTGSAATENVTFDATGKATVKLKNGEALTISGLPAGATWKVEETVPSGYAATYSDNDGTAADGAGTITTGGADVVNVLNTYTVTDVSTNFALSGDKYLVDAAGAAVADQSHTFKFYLQAWNNTASRWEYVNTDGTTDTTLTASAATATARYDGTTTAGAGIDYSAINAALSAWKFSAVNIYTFRVIEANAGKTMNGIYHDQTLHTFEVTVKDNGQGALYVSGVASAHTDAAEVNHWTWSAANNAWVNGDVDFTNTYGTSKLTISIDKAIHDSTGNGYDNTSGYRFLVDMVANGTSKLTDPAGAAWSTYTSTSDTKADGIAQFGMQYVTSDDVTAPQIGSTHIYPTNSGTAVTYYEYYKITEYEPATKVPGITYSDQVYYVEVAVTVTGTDVTADYTVVGRTDPTDTEIVFTNIYSDALSLTLGAAKDLSGREWQTGDSFTFTLTPTQYTKDGVTLGKEFHLVESANGYTAVAGIDANGAKPTATATSKAMTKFGGITFTAIGNYFFTVTENGADHDGLTYDTTAHYIMVAVTANASHKLEARVYSYSLGEVQLANGAYLVANITNTYTTDPATVTLSGKKTLEGRDLAAEEFTFLLRNDDNNVVGVARNDANGNFTFPTLKLEAVGSYHYTIQEYRGGQTLGGIIYDGTVYKVRIDVTDNLKGQLVAEIHYEANGTAQNGVTFSNAQVGKGNLVIAKEVTHPFGVDYQVPDFLKFNMTVTLTLDGVALANQTFEAKQNLNSAITSVTTDANGQFTITLAHDDEIEIYGLLEGTQAVVVEQAPVLGDGFQTPVYWVDGDPSIDGTAYITAYEIADVLVVNNYVPQEIYPVLIHVAGDKVLTGRAWQEGDSFTFQLQKYAGTDANGEPKWTTLGTDTVAYGDSDYTFNFENAMADEQYTAIGTYYYRIVELEPAAPLSGVDYDKTIHGFSVTVTDVNMDGQLEIARVQPARESTLVTSATVDGATHWTVGTTFTNVYDTTHTNAYVEIHKHVTNSAGSALATLEGFQFQIWTYEKAANGTITLKEKVATSLDTTVTGTTRMHLTFDAAGTYHYAVVEVPNTREQAGWSYSTEIHLITIQVTDDGMGSLIAKVSAGETVAAAATNLVTLAFTNIYELVPATLNIDFVSKVLEGRDLRAGEFQFQLTAEPTSGSLLQILDNGVVKTVNAISGTNAADGTVTFEHGLFFNQVGEYFYEITELDNGLGGVIYDNTTFRLVVRVTDNGEGKLVATYHIHNEVSEEVIFHNTYTVSNADHVVIEAEKLLTDITSGGNVALTPKTGDFSFVLKDSTGAVLETVKNVGGKITFSGLSFDQVGTYTYTVSEVKGNLAGIGYDDTVLKVTVTVTDNGAGKLVAKVDYDKAPQFKNTFKADNATIVLAGLKTLTGGRDLKAGEFSFNLKGNGVDETVKNDANGKFVFSELSFDQVGTYTYEMTEIRGEDKQVAYDSSKYTITVTVTYADGVMSAKATVDGKAVGTYGFTNIFTPDAVNVDIDVQKILQNLTEDKMGLDGFLFQMEGEGIRTMATSNAEGIAKFSLSFDQVGTYIYKFTEIKGGVAGMTYDDSVQEVKITVTQDPATGALKATVEGKVSFTNVLADLPPKTGDEFNMSGILLMMGLSLVCVMAVLVLGKKRMF